MSTRFLHQPGEFIPLGCFDACCEFKTDGSIAFQLGDRSDGFLIVGWIDLHFPCDEPFCRCRIRLSIPDDATVGCGPDEIPALVADLFRALAIPADEPYEAQVIFGGTRLQIVNRSDCF